MAMRCAIAAVATALLSAAAPGEGWTHHYFKERVELLEDRSLIAIRFEEGERADALAGLASLGIAPTSVTDWPVRGWALVETAGALARGLDGRALLRDAANAPGVAEASPVFFGEDGGPLFPTRDVLVRFAGHVDAHDALRAAQQHGEVVEDRFGGMEGAMRVRLASRSGADALEAAAELAQRDDVVFAEPDMVFTGRGALTPTDPGFTQCWGLRNTGQFGGLVGFDMDATGAWDITTGSASIIVAVLDTGVELTHPDLNAGPGADFTSDASTNGFPVNQWDNHGTPVAGCISARINNGIGTVGVAPGVRSASARAFISINANGNWTSSSSWTVNALEWASTTAMARVTNNSNSYGFTSGAIASKYAETRAEGLVHFASAGNDSGAPPVYPSSLPTVNAIAALAPDGDLAGFSNFGPGLAFSAPGETIYSTDRTGSAGYSSGNYAFVNGTSFASPYAAGVAALILSQTPSHSAGVVEGLLASTAQDLGDPGYDQRFGWGMVNALSALGGMATAPSAFALTLPPDGAVNVPLGATLSWQSATFADEYELTIARDAALTDVAFSALTTGTTLTLPPGAVSFGVAYHWTIEARNTLGATIATGGPWSFSTGLVGDANGDCAVDFTDLNYVVATFGESGPGVLGDTDGDDDVDFSDLNNVLTSFGLSCGTLSD